MRPLRVLVTGASGFVGRHVIEHLLETTDWSIIALDRTIGRYEHHRIISVTADLTHSMPALPRCHAVINLAAEADVTSFIADPEPLVQVNVDIALTLLQWARSQPLTHFIQVSTNEVFGPSFAGELPDEWTPHSPTTPYSASKSAQEMLAAAWWSTYEVPSVIVTGMHMFGEHQPATRFIPTAVGRLRAGESVPVFGEMINDHWLASTRCWLYVKDFADALRWVIATPRVGARRIPRWNVAGPELSLIELVRDIAHRLGVEPRTQHVDITQARAGHERRYALNARRISMAGWTPPYGFESGLDRTIKWMVNR